MGTFSSWSYTAKATFWTPTYDEFNQPGDWTRTVFNCSYKAGGNLSLDDQQERFIPKTTIFLEAEDGDVPLVGSRVILGESPATNPPASAEVVRVVTAHDPTLFDEGTPDRVLMTG